jgi:hypothetical protein
MLFILFSIALFSTIIYLMPKRMTLLEMYATSWFALTFVMTVDIYLSFKLHLYGYLTKGVINWGMLIIHFGVFPTYNAIFLNFFPKTTKLYQALYILAHSIILVAYEWMTIITGAFYHNSWKLIYSALLYPLILLILYWNLKIIRTLKNREK